MGDNLTDLDREAQAYTELSCDPGHDMNQQRSDRKPRQCNTLLTMTVDQTGF